MTTFNIVSQLNICMHATFKWTAIFTNGKITLNFFKQTVLSI